VFWRRREPLVEPPLDRDDVLAIFDALTQTSGRGRWTSGTSSLERKRAMKMSREEFERRKAEGEESNRLFQERVARMKAEHEAKKRAAAEKPMRPRRLFGLL
jgi:tellurite resistance protein